MPNIPQRLEEADHAVFDIGLLNAGRRAHGRLEQQTFIEEDSREDRLNVCNAVHVPWWLETKYQTPWELKDYVRLATERLADVLQRDHGTSVDVRRDDIRRLLQHWAHRTVVDSVSLHSGYDDPDTKLPCTADDIIRRSRENLRWVAGCKYIETESEEHPLWMRAKYKKMSHKTRRIIDATGPQIQAANYLVGPEFNIKNLTTGPSAEALRAAVPELLSTDQTHMMHLSVGHRATFKKLLACTDLSFGELQHQLTGVITEILFQINPTLDKAITAHQKEGEPDVLNGEPGAVLRAYVEPAITAKDAEKLRSLLPLISYHTLGAVTMKDIPTIRYALSQWGAIGKMMPDLPPRITKTVIMACKIIAADDIDELRAMEIMM